MLMKLYGRERQERVVYILKLVYSHPTIAILQHQTNCIIKSHTNSSSNSAEAKYYSTFSLLPRREMEVTNYSKGLNKPL